MTENVILKDKTGRIMTVDSELDEGRANSNTLMYNKMLDPSEKSTFLISLTQIKDEKEEEILKLKATMVPQTLNPICFEHITFLMKRCE